jgi:hypothetical protein
LNNSVKCEQALGLVKLNTTTNSTKLIDSLESVVKQWSWSERQNFQMFFDQIRQLIFLSELSPAEKVLQIAKTVRFFENQDSKLEQKLIQTRLSGWGTLDELCLCVGI